MTIGAAGLTPEQEARARQLIKRTREAQGLPERITDPAVLRRWARLLLSFGKPEPTEVVTDHEATERANLMARVARQQRADRARRT